MTIETSCPCCNHVSSSDDNFIVVTDLPRTSSTTNTESLGTAANNFLLSSRTILGISGFLPLFISGNKIELIFISEGIRLTKS